MIVGRSHRPAWARVGQIVKAHGIRGEVKVVLDSATRTSAIPGAKVYLADPSGALCPERVQRVKPLRGAAAVKLSGIQTREDAERVRGRWIFVPRSSLPPLPEREFYLADLIGVRVWDPSGQEIGSLVDVMDTGGTDVWIVQGPGDPVFLPATREAIVEVNVEEGYVIARPLESV